MGGLFIGGRSRLHLNLCHVALRVLKEVNLAHASLPVLRFAFGRVRSDADAVEQIVLVVLISKDFRRNLVVVQSGAGAVGALFACERSGLHPKP